MTIGILGDMFVVALTIRNTNLSAQLSPNRSCWIPAHAWKGHNPNVSAAARDTCTTAITPALLTTTTAVSPSFNTTPHTHLDFPKKAETF